MSNSITVSQGLTANYVLTIRDSSGKAYTAYTGTEPLAASVRAGRDTAPLFVLAPAWIDATLGTIALAIPGTSTAALDAGRYLLQVKLADNSADLYEGFLDVDYSPGTAVALPSYGGYSDMLDRAPWLTKLQTDTDLAGFARQRQQARRWFEDILHRHYRYSGTLSADYAFIPGISFAGGYGTSTFLRDGRRSKELQQWLDADRLDVTQQVIDACTYYALALVCERQVSPGKQDSSYGQLSRTFYQRAEDIALNITAEIDTDGDGANDTAIRLGLADTLDG